MTYRKSLTTLFCSVLLLSINLSFAKRAAAAIPRAPQFQAKFRDVSGSNIYYDAISYVKYMGIVQGYSDGTFRPSNPINRAEFTKIIMSSRYAPGTINKCDIKKLEFKDVPKNAWFAPYICLAVEKGIIKGYPDNTFRPSWDIQFTEAAKIVATTFQLDIGQSTIWYEPFIQALADNSAIPQTIKGLTHRVTRSEMASMVYRLKKHITEKPSNKFIEVVKRAPQPDSKYVPESKTKVTVPIRYNDGWFMHATSFLIKSGKKVRIAVEVTLEKDIVKKLEVKPRSGDPASYSYVQIFSNDFSKPNIGKKLDEIQLPEGITKSSSIGSAVLSALVDIRKKALKK